jgi:cysteinylglycine-S-conjugate dipeptidase
MAGRQRFAQLVESSMADLRAELARLVAIPSVSAPGFPKETHGPLLEAHEAVAGLFRDAGAGVDALELPDTAPIVTGEIHPPA